MNNNLISFHSGECPPPQHNSLPYWLNANNVLEKQDPIFFQHHSAVDQWWNAWQRLNSSNLFAVGGFTTPGCTQPGGTCNPMTYDSVLNSLGLKRNYTVLDMLDTTKSPLCYVYDA